MSWCIYPRPSVHSLCHFYLFLLKNKHLWTRLLGILLIILIGSILMNGNTGWSFHWSLTFSYWIFSWSRLSPLYHKWMGFHLSDFMWNKLQKKMMWFYTPFSFLQDINIYHHVITSSKVSNFTIVWEMETILFTRLCIRQFCKTGKL